MEARTDTVKEKDPIAWIEMKHYGDIDEIKQDIRELSERVVKKNSNIFVGPFSETLEEQMDNVIL